MALSRRISQEWITTRGGLIVSGWAHSPVLTSALVEFTTSMPSSRGGKASSDHKDLSKHRNRKSGFMKRAFMQRCRHSDERIDRRRNWLRNFLPCQSKLQEQSRNIFHPSLDILAQS